MNDLCQMNENIGFDDEFGMFEIGRVVNGLKEDGLCDEHKKLAITLYSKNGNLEVVYYKLRDMLETLVKVIKHDYLAFAKKEASHSYQNPKNLNAIVCQGNELGEIGIVHPNVVNRMNRKAVIVYAELDVTAFSSLIDKGIVYSEHSKFPAIEVDLSFVAETSNLMSFVVT